MTKNRAWELEMMKELERDKRRLRTMAYSLALVCAVFLVAFILWK
jgi:hypothetical protein